MRSKAQKTTTLSSAEAEWMALSEATKELIFVLQLLKAMKINVTLPIVTNVDNMGSVLCPRTSILQDAVSILTYGQSMLMSMWRMDN